MASIAAFITALYSSRLILIAFFGELRTEPHDSAKANMSGPLLVLAALALGGGWIGLAPLAAVLPDGGLHDGGHDTTLAWATMAVPFAGLASGYLLFGPRRRVAKALLRSRFGDAVGRFWFSGWGCDRLYDVVFVRPFVVIARLNKGDVVDRITDLTTAASRCVYNLVTLTQTGRLRWYAANMAIGITAIMLIVLGLR